MQDHEYLLAALDMDGTLLNTDHVSTPFTREVLRQAAEAGKITALATGRCLAELKDHLDTFSDVRYVIDENGAHVYDALEHKCIRRTPMDDQDVEYIISLNDEYDMICQFFILDKVYMRFSKDGDFARYNLESFQSVFTQTSIFDEELFEHCRSLPVDKINLYFRTHEARSAVRPLLKARGLTVADSVGVGLEISKQGINKAVGLQTLCDYLGIDLDDTMAIGDGGNDVELLQTAGLGVAMGNAGPDVAATADVVTDDCDHDGAAHAIMRYMLEKI